MTLDFTGTMTIWLNVKKLHSEAKLPTYATEGAACFDLYAFSCPVSEKSYPSDETWDCRLDHKYPMIFGTGLSVEMPKGYALMIYSRSGHGFNQDIRLANSVGIIDSDYRGEVKVKLTKDAFLADHREDMIIRKFDRIAQAMLIPVPRTIIHEVTALSETERGTGGFGSTG